MTQETIKLIVEKSQWQPVFVLNKDLSFAVDSILIPHEDYFLGLHSKVKEIITREVDYISVIGIENYSISFTDVCGWQKELLEHKLKLIDELASGDDRYLADKALSLPNRYIETGLRKYDVKLLTSNYTPPSPMHLQSLLPMSFPINGGDFTDGDVVGKITYWYKVFETIHFFDDLNGRVGGVLTNILAKAITGSYIVNEKYFERL